MGAAFAVLGTLAYAKVPGMPHGGASFGGQPHAGFQHGGRSGAPAYRTYGAHSGRSGAADRNVRLVHGSGDGNGHGGYNEAQRYAAAGNGYRMDNNRNDTRGGFQYAGAITTVSAETHSVPRPPEDESMVRAGSIRADVARYNEERGATRPVARPPGYMSRPPEASPYRN